LSAVFSLLFGESLGLHGPFFSFPGAHENYFIKNNKSNKLPEERASYDKKNLSVMKKKREIGRSYELKFFSKPSRFMDFQSENEFSSVIISRFLVMSTDKIKKNEFIYQN